MADILVTGCSGFLASHLMPLLRREAGNRLNGLTEVPGFTAPGMNVFHADVRDGERVQAAVAEIRPEVVFHLAAITNVAYAWKNPTLTYEVNFIGSANLFEALRRHAPNCRVLVMSSAEIYSNSGQTLSESSPLHCQNPYALSKLAMEMAAEMYWQVYGLEVIRLRSFNFTGPGQDRKFVASDFAWQIARIEAGEQEPLIRIGNLSALRDFSDVRDIARYLMAIAASGRGGEIFNLCSGRLFPISRILEMLLRLSSRNIRVETDPDRFRPVDAQRLTGDCDLIRQRFQLEPSIAMEQTLSDLLDWWRRQLGVSAQPEA
jgi:GDP-4-dehydro-6-deoxy-D-mannose reductase